MSVLYPVGGVLQEPKHLKLPDTSANDVLALTAGDAAVAIVIGLIIVNQGGSANKVTVWRTEDTTDYAIFERSVAANETVTIALDAPLRLYAKSTARKIRAQAATANEVTVSVIYTLTSQSGNAG